MDSISSHLVQHARQIAREIGARALVLYADALKYRDQLDTIFWVIATEGRDHPLNGRLGEVKVPTLIIWGRHDKLLDVSCVPVLEAGIAGSVSHIFEHVGHVRTCSPG